MDNQHYPNAAAVYFLLLLIYINCSNIDACNLGCGALALPVIVVSNHVFPASTERHHPACQTGPPIRMNRDACKLIEYSNVI